MGPSLVGRSLVSDLGAERMADMIVKPEASDLLRCVGHESGLNAELEEFKFTAEGEPYLLMKGCS